jgi:hypothetical protein
MNQSAKSEVFLVMWGKISKGHDLISYLNNPTAITELADIQHPKLCGRVHNIPFFF